MKKRKKLKISSIIKFYWVLLLFGIVMGPLTAYYTQSYFQGIEHKAFISLLVLNLAASVIFFDTLNIVFLKATLSYETVAQLVKKAHKEKQIEFFFMTSSGLLLGSLIVMFYKHICDSTSIICFISTLLLGWFITGVIQMLRFK